MKVRENKSGIICLKPVHDKVKSTEALEWVKGWISNQVYNSIASVSSHFQSFFPSWMKRFTTKGKQTLSHFLEKLLITKAIKQIQQSMAERKFSQTPTLIYLP